MAASIASRGRPMPGSVCPPASISRHLHLPQHLVAPRFRGARVEQRVVFGGRLRQPGQQRRLRQAQLPDRLGEVDLRGGADPDRGAAFDRPVGGDVEVGAEDFPARVALGVLDRQLRLDDLALERLLGVADAEVADQLLGDRRAALDRFAGFEVLDRGAQDPLGVERRRARRSAGPRSPPSPAAASSGSARSRPACALRRRRSTPSLLPSAA